MSYLRIRSEGRGGFNGGFEVVPFEEDDDTEKEKKKVTVLGNCRIIGPFWLCHN